MADSVGVDAGAADMPTSLTNSASDAFYFLQSPFILDEMKACVRTPARSLLLEQRGLARRMRRLRRGDLQCSFLVDERNRPVLAHDNDRALNRHGTNSFAASAAGAAAAAAASPSASSAASSPVAAALGAGSSLSAIAAPAARPSPGPASAALVPALRTPTHPLLLYLTDGAKRTLPLALLQSVALRRGAARLGLPLHLSLGPAPAAIDPRLVPDVVVRVMGGSDALNARILDDKCRMQRLLAHKPYVPHTVSLDITVHGWQQLLRLVFATPDGVRRASAAAAAATSTGADPGSDTGSNAAPTSTASVSDAAHQCAPSCSSRSVILKPSQGHKQRGLLVLPQCPLSLPEALVHVGGQVRPGGLKGLFETWVAQEFVQNHLAISGFDLASLHEEPQTEVETAGSGREETSWRRMLQPAPSDPAAEATATAASHPVGSSNPPPAVASGGVRAASRIHHSPSPLHPYFPSESGPVHALGMHKVHLRMFAMVRLDARTGRYDTYWANLCKVYHAPEHARMIRVHQQQQQQGQAQSALGAVASSLLVAKSVSDDSCASFPNLSAEPFAACLTPTPAPAASVRADVAVSASLCPRLAHHIFPAAALRRVMLPMAAIVVDSVREAIEAGGLQPTGNFARPVEEGNSLPVMRGGIPLHGDCARALRPGLAECYFQFLGYDFLVDTSVDVDGSGDDSSAPLPVVLLEVNHNVGQGIPSQDKMARQVAQADGQSYGHSNAQFLRRKEYWRRHFRTPYIEGAMRINLDAFHTDPTGAANAPHAPPPLTDWRRIPLPSSPPSPDVNCWIHADTYYRKSREP